MALEDLLTKLIASLDANTAALKEAKGGAAAAAATAPATPKSDKKQPAAPTFNQVKVAAEKVMAKHGKPFAKKMIADVGAAKELAAVKPDKYPALFKAFEAALAEVEEEAATEAEEEDEL